MAHDEECCVLVLDVISNLQICVLGPILQLTNLKNPGGALRLFESSTSGYYFARNSQKLFTMSYSAGYAHHITLFILNIAHIEGSADNLQM